MSQIESKNKFTYSIKSAEFSGQIKITITFMQINLHTFEGDLSDKFNAI